MGSASSGGTQPSAAAAAQASRFIHKLADGSIEAVDVGQDVDVEAYITDTLASNPGIEYIQPDYMLSLFGQADSAASADYADSAAPGGEESGDSPDADEAIEAKVGISVLYDQAESLEDDGIDGLDVSDGLDGDGLVGLDGLDDGKVPYDSSDSDNGAGSFEGDGVDGAGVFDGAGLDVSGSHDVSDGLDGDGLDATDGLDGDGLVGEGLSDEGLDDIMSGLGGMGVTPGEGVTVIAIIDSAIDMGHGGLAPLAFVNPGDAPDGSDNDANGYADDVCGWDYVDGDNDAGVDGDGRFDRHGTHVAGVVSGVVDPKYGLTALAGAGVSVLPLRAFRNGRALTSDVVKAIRYADSMGADVINCSWGGADENRALREAVEGSRALFVCAAGGTDGRAYFPAEYGSQGADNVLSVAGAMDDGSQGRFLGRAGNADVSAPGWDIASAAPGGGMGGMSGSSVSAAFASARAVRMLAAGPAMQAAALKRAIVGGAGSQNPGAAASPKNPNAAAFGMYPIMPAAGAQAPAGQGGLAGGVPQPPPSPTQNRLARSGPAGAPKSALSGSGTSSDPYLVSDAQDLEEVYSNLLAHYKMTDDIDLQGNEFCPIGSMYYPFSGTFDGDGHSISGLYVSMPYEHTGLFGYVDRATIKNLDVLDADLTSYQASVGILAGCANKGTIENCVVTGEVSAYWDGGGLIGALGNAAVSRCGAEIEIHGDGGLGGLIGYSYGAPAVSDCYAAGEIHSSVRSAGLVGDLFGTGGDFARCYAVVEIVCPQNGSVRDLFSFFGTHASAYADACYYRADLYPRTDVSAEGKTDAQLKQKGTFVGWDFDDVWSIDPGNAYPALRREQSVAGAAISQTMTLTPASGSVFVALLKAEGIGSFTGKGFTLRYDPAKLQLASFAAHAGGMIAGTPLAITAHYGGKLDFTYTRTVPAGKSWSGVLTAVKFKALAGGPTEISLEMK